MTDFKLNAAAAAELPADAELVCFEPTAADILPKRAAYRAVLLEAVRHSVPVAAEILGTGGWEAESGDVHDALCELLSCVSFLKTDLETAVTIGVPLYGAGKAGDGSLPLAEDPSPETALTALHRRFGLETAALADCGLIFDGERFTAI